MVPHQFLFYQYLKSIENIMVHKQTFFVKYILNYPFADFGY